ncbi:calcium/proton exchanger [Tanacetum coccineum]
MLMCMRMVSGFNQYSISFNQLMVFGKPSVKVLVLYVQCGVSKVWIRCIEGSGWIRSIHFMDMAKVKMVTFTVDLYHDGYFISNLLQYVYGEHRVINDLNFEACVRDVDAEKCAGKRGKKQQPKDHTEPSNSDGNKSKEPIGDKGKEPVGDKAKEPSNKGKTDGLFDHEVGLKDHYSGLVEYGKAVLDFNRGSTCYMDLEVRDDGLTYFKRWLIGNAMEIKSLYPDHKCCRNYNLGSLVTFKWVAHHHVREIIDNPWISYKYMQNSIKEKFMINVSLGQCRREKQMALFDHEGGLKDHYSRLWQYRQAVLDSNPGSTCHMNLEGLIDAVGAWLSEAEHRQCTRHIYANFKKKLCGLQFKRLFWLIALSTMDQQLLNNMAKIKSMDEKAYNWLIEKNLNTWCRAYFEQDKGTAAFENGILESFNSRILSARGEPIITMLEDIRIYLMQRVWFINKTAMELQDSITPFARRQLEAFKIKQRSWVVYPSGFRVVEVRRYDESFGVNIHLKKYVCRMWELTGIPCVHAVAAYTHLKLEPKLGVLAAGEQQKQTVPKIQDQNLKISMRICQMKKQERGQIQELRGLLQQERESICSSWRILLQAGEDLMQQ